MADKDKLLDAIMKARQAKQEKKVAERGVAATSLADKLFKRRREQEDAYKQLQELD